MELGSRLSELVNQELEERDGCLRANGLEMGQDVLSWKRFDGVGVGGEDLNGEQAEKFRLASEDETKSGSEAMTDLHRPVEVLVKDPSRGLEDQRHVIRTEREEVADCRVELVFWIGIVLSESEETETGQQRNAMSGRAEAGVLTLEVA